MLTILNDPAGITGRRHHAWDYGISLQANIERHLVSGEGCRLVANGVELDPTTVSRMHAPPSVADRVVVSRRPGVDAITWAYVAIAALTVAVYALMPRPPNPGNVGKDSPNNSLTGQTNRPRAYQAIPDVYGFRRLWPDIIQPATVEYIDHIKYVTEWLCLSRGKGTLSDVQYAETAIGDIAEASYEAFEPVAGGDGYPENGTTTLLDVLEAFESPEVNGQEMAPATPWATITPTGSIDTTASSATFTITVPDGPSLDQLKSLAGTGTADVAFDYFNGAETVPFVDTCSVDSFMVAGGDCEFTLTAGATWGTSETDTGVVFTITPNDSTPDVLGPYTLPVECNRIRWNTVFLRGLRGSVSTRAEWWQVDGDGVEIGGTRQHQDNTYTADTYDQRFWTNDVTPTAGTGRYRIQFARLTPQIGDGNAEVAKLEEVYAVRHYAEKVLPGVTVIRVTTKATSEATGYSERKFNARWLRHVRELDSDTLSESRNFARAIAHIWTLAGNDMAELDTDALQAINTEHGEDSELLRFDASLDDADMSLGERIRLAANTARCLIWRDGTQWTVTRNQASAYPEVQFDYRNLARGGESAISYSSHLPATWDGVEVEYVDEATQAKKAYVRLDISTGEVVTGTSSNPLKIQLIGCATESQAANRAHLEARTLLYQRENVNDKALCDFQGLGLGALVRWVDPNDFAGDDGLQAGEVRAVEYVTPGVPADGAVLTTSEPLDWKGETTGRILLTGADGSYLGSAPYTCTPDGTRVALATAPAGIFAADANRQLGTRYAFAVGLTEAEMEAAGLYSVTSIKPDSRGVASLTLAAYDARIFQED